MVMLQEKVQAWGCATNDKQKDLDRLLTTNDARLKIKSLYPRIKY